MGVLNLVFLASFDKGYLGVHIITVFKTMQ